MAKLKIKVEKPGQIILMQNLEKVKGSKQPDFKGKFMDEVGNVYVVSAWKQKGESGVIFLKGNVISEETLFHKLNKEKDNE